MTEQAGHKVVASETGGTTQYLIVPDGESNSHVSFTDNGRLDIHTGNELLSYDGCFFDRETFTDIQSILGGTNMVHVRPDTDAAATLDAVLENLVTADCHRTR